MKKVAIYTRKSRLSDTGDSIGTQIKLIKDYFRNQECKFEVFEDEGFSGGNTNRPAFKLMMEKVKKKEFNIVAVYKIDRIARNIIDFFKIFDVLEKEKVSIVSISEGFDASTPMGVMIMTMLAGFAEMERMNIKQRVKDNMIELAKKGKWTGGTLPLGYKAFRTIESGKECSYLKIKDDEKEMIEEIYNLFIEGYSINKISKIFHKKYGINANPNRVSNILYSPIYVESSDIVKKYLELNNYEVYGETNGNGYLTYQKTTRQGGTSILDRKNKTIVATSKHKAIINSTLWLKTQERLKEIATTPSPRISQYTFLAKMVKCSYCGATMNACSSIRNGKTSRFFRKSCNCNHGNKKGSRLYLERAEKFVFKYLENFLDTGVEKYLKENMSRPSQKDESAILKKELSKLDKMINSLTDKLALANDDVSEIFFNRIEELVNKKKSLQEQLLILEQRKNFESIKSNNAKILENTIEKFVKNFNKMTIQEKQIEIRKIFKFFTWDGNTEAFEVKIVEL